MKNFCLLSLLIILFVCGCGTSSDEPNSAKASSQSSILISQVLARAVPSEVTHQRFSGYDVRGGLVYGPTVVTKGPSTLLNNVPVDVVSLQIEQLAEAELVGVGSLDVELQSGQSLQIQDPPTRGLSAPVQFLQVTPGESCLALNGALKFTATATLTNKEQVDLSDSIVWGSSRPEVARASTSGKVRAQTNGETTIIGRLGQIQATSLLKVSQERIASLQISPTNIVLADDTSQQMTALAQLSDGSFQDVSRVVRWDTTGSASIDENGLLLVNDPGTVEVRASLADMSVSTDITTTSAVPVKLILSDPEGGHFPLATSRRLIADAVFSDSTQQNVARRVSWSSSNPSVAEVNNEGVVSALQPGEVDITGQFASVSGAVRLTVSSQTVVGLRVEPSAPTIADDTEIQLQAVAILSDGQERVLSEGLSWRSLTPERSTLSPFGLLTGVNPGEANFEVTHLNSRQTAGGGVSISAARLTALAVFPSDALSTPGTTRQYKAMATFSDSTVQDVTNRVIWSSDNPKIFFPDQTTDRLLDGRAQIQLGATSDSLGSTIRASLDSFSATAKLRIDQFVYLCDASSNQVSSYRLLPNGGLSALGTTTVSAPVAMAISPDGRFAYTLSRNSPGITAFIIQPTGVLRSFGLPVTVDGSGRSIDLEMAPDGRFLYATRSGGRISQFRVNGDGTLTQSRALDSVDPGFMTSSSSGSELLVTNAADGRVSTFSVDSEGGLTLVGRAVVGGSNDSLEGLKSQQDGAFATLLTTDSVSQNILTLGQKTDRLFAPLSSFSINLNLGPVSTIANDPLDRFCYALQGDFLNVLAFRPDGKLEFVDRDIIQSTMDDILALKVDPTGRFLIFPNYEPGSVFSLTIQSDGTTAPQASAPTSAQINAIEMTP